MITRFSDVVLKGRLLLLLGFFMMVEMVCSVTTHHVSPFVSPTCFGGLLGLMEDSMYGLWIIEIRTF